MGPIKPIQSSSTQVNLLPWKSLVKILNIPMKEIIIEAKQAKVKSKINIDAIKQN